MKKILLAIICAFCFAFGGWATSLAVDDKALYDENASVVIGYYADSHYPSKNAGHLAECQNEMQIAKSDLTKHSVLSGCMYFAGTSTGACLIYITIKNRKSV